VGVKCWKVGSAETTDPWLLNHLIDTKLPIIASTGMSSFQEIDTAVSLVKEAGISLALLQCTSAYPCPPERVGLNVLAELRERYEIPVGLSDHSGEVFAPLAAMALGADLIEAHIVFDQRMFGPDSIASLNPSQFALVCRAADEISTMRNNPVDKNELAESSLTTVRHVFERRLVVAMDLLKGDVVTPEHLTFKKASSGISVKELENVLGKVLTRDVNKGQLLSKTDFVTDE